MGGDLITSVWVGNVIVGNVCMCVCVCVGACWCAVYSCVCVVCVSFDVTHLCQSVAQTDV